MRFRRLKLPVFSRLTLAWIAFASIGIGAVAYGITDFGRGQTAVKMAVEGIERLAPPEKRTEGHTLAEAGEGGDAREAQSPMLASVANQFTAGDDAEDTLSSLTDGVIQHEPDTADVVITVDGAPARAIGAKKEPAASLNAAVSIASPSAKLLRRSAYGKIPRISATGEKASRYYARAFKENDLPIVGLIVGGLGLNRAITERAIDELPPSVTLAFAPYSKDLVFWSKRARDAGHEIMIEIPMENRKGDAETLGPAALLTTRTTAENTQRLDWILSRFQGYFGATNYLGAKFSGDRHAMAAVLDIIKGAGLAYIDDTGLLRRTGADIDATTVNLLINPGYGSERAETARDLDGLEKIAAREGAALGKTYVNDATLTDIVKWAENLGSHDMVLAPASAIIAKSAVDRRTATR